MVIIRSATARNNICPKTMSCEIRLFVETAEIKANQMIEINDNDFNYLTKVMRKKIGDELLIFNGFHGEWLSKIIEIGKKSCLLQTLSKTKEQYFPPNITLAFAPVKNVRIDFIAAKATELGIRKFQPIITQHTIVDKINSERFRANIKEAAEQCERLDLPEILPVIKLGNFLKNLDENQKSSPYLGGTSSCDSRTMGVNNTILILCDESGNGVKSGAILPKLRDEKKEIIIFTGPEGGFSKSEFEQFNQLKNLHKISLGPRILRADTAIISAITLVQEFLGDFDLKPNFQ